MMRRFYVLLLQLMAPLLVMFSSYHLCYSYQQPRRSIHNRRHRPEQQTTDHRCRPPPPTTRADFSTHHIKNDHDDSSTMTINLPTTRQPRISRRKLMSTTPVVAVVASASMILSGVFCPARSVAAAPVSSSSVVDQTLQAQETLATLLDNWNRATIDCTFADVPRELLQTANKEQLLEKASTFALFDKSVSVESCKTTNRIVRDYLGVTGKGPLVQMEKTLSKAIVFLKDPDKDMDAFVTESESFSQAYSRAKSLSYTAGIADLDSVNNFDKERPANEINPNSNLEQTKVAIQSCKTSLDRIVGMLEVPPQ